MSDIRAFHLRDFAALRRRRLLKQSVEPTETSTRVPLKLAIEELGKAKFPREWSGFEQFRFDAPDLPAPIDGGAGSLFRALANDDSEIARWTKEPDADALIYAELLLSEFAPEEALRRNSLQAYLAVPPVLPSFSSRLWRKAMDLAALRRELIHEEWRRVLRVCEDFKIHCVEGRLKTYLRPVGGGQFDDALPWWIWNGESINPRFVTYQMNPLDPFLQQPQTKPSHWIFADRSDLDAIITALDGKKRPTAAQLDDLYLSPYMRCALDTIRALNVTQDNMPKKEPLIASLAEHWHGEGELSQKMKECIAKVIRDEDSRAGRASEHQKKRQAAAKVGR